MAVRQRVQAAGARALRARWARGVRAHVYHSIMRSYLYDATWTVLLE
jgi:hypothetical protein